jgi:hypothetical protein
MNTNKGGTRMTAGGFTAALIFAVLRAASHAPTPADVHAELAEYTRTIKLPSKVDDITTMTAVRLDGDVITYTYDVKGLTKADFEAYHDSSEADRTEKVCGDSLTRKVIDAGIAIHSEYRNSGATLGEIVISSCPVKAAAADNKDPFDGPLAYSYDLVGGRIIIHAKGNVGVDEPTALNAWWSALPKNATDHMKVGMITLALDSPGGSVMGAAHLSQWVKDNKVDTVVPNGAQCASACVLIWGAGEHKFAGESAQLGVHNASTRDDKTAVAAEGTVFTARALADEKAPPAVIAAAATTPSSDVHWLTTDDLVAWGTTMIDKDGKTTPWGANNLY